MKGARVVVSPGGTCVAVPSSIVRLLRRGMPVPRVRPFPRPAGVAGAAYGSSEVASASLFSFDCLEERLEVALPEAACSLALDDLVEDGGAVLHRLGEDLQQVAVRIPIDQDAQL